MAISVVQTATPASTGLSVSFTSAVTSGNAVVVCVYAYGSTSGAVSSVTRGGSSTGFTQSASSLASSAGDYLAAIWINPKVTASGQTAVAATMGAGTGYAILAYEIAGLNSASYLNVSSSGNSGNASSWSSGSVATTQASEIWIGAVFTG